MVVGEVVAVRAFGVLGTVQQIVGGSAVIGDSSDSTVIDRIQELGNGRVALVDFFESRPSQIAERLGVTTRDVNDAIHALKTDLPRGGPVRNPDVVVDAVSGEVFPQLPGGGIGDSIGNIFDELPGAG